MGSIFHNGVRLQIYSADHMPMHAHCSLGNAEVIVELSKDGTVRVAQRADAVQNAKRNDLNRILTAAQERSEDLLQLWEHTHGKS
jgi:hypothetical protein